MSAVRVLFCLFIEYFIYLFFILFYLLIEYFIFIFLFIKYFIYLFLFHLFLFSRGINKELQVRIIGSRVLQKSISDYLWIEKLISIFIFIINQTNFRFVHNHKVDCHYDYIPLNLKVITSEQRERISY